MTPAAKRLGSLLVLFSAGRARGALAVGLVLISGLTEIIGVMSIFPLLQMTGRNNGSSGAAEDLVSQVFALAGFSVSVGSLLTVIIVALALKALFFVLAMRQVGNLAADLVTSLRLQLLQAVAEARWSYFVRKSIGSLANSMGTEAMRVSNMLTESCFFLAAAVQVCLYVIGSFIVSFQVTVGAVIVGLLLVIALRGLIKISQQAGERETVSLESLLSRLTSLLGIMKPAKAMAREEGLVPILRTESQNLNTAYRHQVVSKAVLVAGQEPLIALFLGVGLYLALAKGSSMEEMLFLSLLFYRILTRLGNAQGHLQSLRALESAYRSLVGSIREATALKEELGTGSPPELRESVRIDHATVSYDGHPVFQDLNVVIEVGSFTVVVGPSGVGKTTLLDLVCGLIDPDEGSVSIDGISLRDVNKRAWRAKIGYIPQLPTLVDGTIFTNVVLGMGGIGDDQVENALAQAGAMEFVQRTTHGIHTQVGEGGSALSGGQRQRIAIARALIMAPKFLICDEATSALDRETERSVLGALRRLDTTILAVSHHEAPTAFADRVYELRQDGKAYESVNRSGLEVNSRATATNSRDDRFM